MLYINDVGYVQVNSILPDKLGVSMYFSGNKLTVPISECEPIKLTEKILVEWCGFEEQTDSAQGIGEYSWYSRLGLDINNDIGGWFVTDPQISIRFRYLHELQLLYAVLKKDLPITIK